MPYFARPYQLPSEEEIRKSLEEQRLAFKRAVIRCIGEEDYLKYSFDYLGQDHGERENNEVEIK